MVDNNNSKQPAVVPFGKYKGQPIEVMAADPQYVEWLNGQGWVKDKYPQFYTVIINNFQEPSDTPEHNAIQALFLEKELRQKLISFVFPSLTIAGISSSVCLLMTDWVPEEFEVDGIDVLIRFEFLWKHELDKAMGKIGNTFYSSHQGYREFGKDDAVYECMRESAFALEIKPSLGDDFPSVLRQAKRIKYPLKGVMFRDFVATSVTLGQVRSMFERSDIYLFSLAEIQEAEIDTRYDEWYAENFPDQ